MTLQMKGGIGMIRSFKRLGTNVKVILSILVLLCIGSIYFTSSIPAIILVTLGIALLVNGIVQFAIHISTPSIFRSIDLTFLAFSASIIIGISLLYNVLINYIHF